MGLPGWGHYAAQDAQAENAGAQPPSGQENRQVSTEDAGGEHPGGRQPGDQPLVQQHPGGDQHNVLGEG